MAVLKACWISVIAFAAVALPLSSAHAETYLGAALGYQSWSALRDLTPEAGGTFNAGAPVLSGTAHWPIQRFSNLRVLAGADIGYFSHDSDVAGFRTDLSATGFYAASSMIVARPGRAGFFELGVGIYRVSLQEEFVRIDGFTNAPGSPPSKAHEQQEFGVLIGGGMMIASGAGGEGGWTIGGKLHFPSFGDTSGLGENAGSLSGPILMLQFGFRFSL